MASPVLSTIVDDSCLYSPDVLLATLSERIQKIFTHSLHNIAAINPKVVFKSPERISRHFPTIKVKIITSSNDIYELEALLDSGAYATYISPSFVEDHHIPKAKLPHPIYAYNANDTLNSTAITHRVKLGCAFKGHVSSEWFFVTNIGSKDMIIGMTWL